MICKRFKIFLFFLLIYPAFISCTDKVDCSFITVEDLDKADFKKCPPDSDFVYMRKFSGGLDSMRKIIGIPLLPKDFRIVITTEHGEARWENTAGHDLAFKQPFMHHKSIAWKNDSLTYDLTSFSANDSLRQYVRVKYWLDTTSTPRDYKLQYFYGDKNTGGDFSRLISRQQVDSILNSWGLRY